MEDLGGTAGIIPGWKKAFTAFMGWTPDVEFLPALPAAAIVYLSVYLIGLLLHTVTRLVAPAAVREYLLDFIKTMTLCAYPFGHGIMRKFYGEVGYMSAMVPVVFITLTTMADGSGNPIGVWLQYFRKQMPWWKCGLKNVIQVIAGISAYHLGMYILNLQLHPVYVQRLKEYYSSFCVTDLNVPMHVGFMLEFVAVIYDSWFASQTFTKLSYLDLVMKTINSGLLVVAGEFLISFLLDITWVKHILISKANFGYFFSVFD